MCSPMLSTLFNSNNPMGVNININPLLQINKLQLREDEELLLNHIPVRSKTMIWTLVCVPTNHCHTPFHTKYLIQDKLSFSFHKGF